VKRLLTLLYHDVYAAEPAESGFAGAGADRYKLPLPEFDLQLDGLAAVLEVPPVTLDRPVPQQGGVPVAITVDDGGLSYHSEVADRLESRGWRGHCFMTSGWIGRPGFLGKQQLRELHRRGHVIGSHSVSHPARFAACTPAEMLREWRESRAELQDVLGAAVNIASVPGGYFSAKVAETAAEAGLTTLFTSEPEIRVRRIGGCTVYGRYAIRRGDGSGHAAALAARRPGAVYPAWLKWNAKKLLKAALGAGYPQLAGRLATLAGNHEP
jgi:peptidoglycan/xylan/chitin deacetylase (PgdA/CDA1 family)